MSNKIRKYLVCLLYCIIFLCILAFVSQFLYSPIFLLIKEIGEIIGYSSSREVVTDPSTGLEIIDYGLERTEFVGVQYNPVTIAQSALKHFEKFKITQDQDNLDKAINHVDWLKDNLVENEQGVFVWLYRFDYPRYQLTAPWYSGMAQGLGIKSLTVAYEVTGRYEYFELASLAFGSFTKDIAEGGVRWHCEKGYWYEEYCSPQIQPPLTLNGFIFSLLGIKKYSLYSDDENVKYAFDSGVACLKTKLKEYDILGLWSYHNSLGIGASRSYHALHVELLEELYDCTGESLFREYALKWKRGTYLPVILELLIARNRTNNIMLSLLVIVSIIIVLVLRLIIRKILCGLVVNKCKEESH